MALSKRNSAEGGTAGVQATSASGGNTGGASGDYFDAVSSTIFFKDDWVAHGSKSYGIDNAGTASGVLRWADSATTHSRGRASFGINATIPSDFYFLHLQTVAGTAFYVVGKSSQKMWLYDGAATVVWQGSVNLPSDLSKIRIEWRNHFVGTSATDGTIELAWYNGDSLTPVETSGLLTGNFGNASTLTNMRYGKYGTNAYTGQIRIDDVAYDSGVTNFSNWIGPVVTNVAPTVYFGPDQLNVEPGKLVTITATPNDADGTASITSIVQAGGSPTVTLSGSGNSRTFIAPASISGGNYTLQATATDNGGLTATASTTVSVLPASIHLKTASGILPAILFPRRT